MKFVCLVFISIFFFAAGGYSAWSNMKDVRAAVLDFSVTGDENFDAKMVTELFQASLVDQKAFVVLERMQITKILAEQKLSMSGLTDTEQVMKLGKLLGADKIITGTLSRVGGSLILVVKVIDAKSGVVEISDKVYASSIQNMVNRMGMAAERLVKKARGENVPDMVMDETGTVNDSGGKQNQDVTMVQSDTNLRILIRMCDNREFTSPYSRYNMLQMSRLLPIEKRIELYRRYENNGFNEFRLNFIPFAIGSWVYRDVFNGSIITIVQGLGLGFAVLNIKNYYWPLGLGAFGVAWAWGLVAPWIHASMHNNELKEALSCLVTWDYGFGGVPDLAMRDSDLVHVNLLSMEF